MTDDEPPVVSREAARAAADSAWARKRVLIGSVVVVLVLAGAGVVLALAKGGEVPAETAVSPTTSTTTTPPTTTIAEGPSAPLTGVALDPGDEALGERLNRPALVAKVDNAPEAMPQIGLEKADIVIELKVEGISRYMAVLHSQDATRVGPIRSARTSDPDILAMFVRPLVAWSGGNPTVTKVMNSTPWIQSLNPDQAPNAYSRNKAKQAPHNLILDVPVLYTYADQPPAVPTPIFGYLPAGTDPGGSPVPGFHLTVGKSPSTWVWSGDAGTWLRWANGARQRVEGGAQIGSTNVVVLQTRYTTSGADRLSPEAQTIGDGTAWVFTQGRMIEGRWQRDEPAQPWRLSTSDGQPIQLTPGNTWVELPAGDVAPALLDQGAVDSLLGG